jgi:iron transport multicopper oxidase
MALVQLWSSWNIKPSAVIGHSLGEYAALFAAGILSASDTLYLTGRRATLLQTKCSPSTHSMLAVNMPLNGVRNALAAIFDDLETSCINGPSNVVVSGPNSAIQEAGKILKANGTSCSMLNVPFAFHSSQVDPILASFDKEVIAIPFLPSRVPIFSTLLGQIIQAGDEIGPSYLVRHAREPVQFLDALNTAQEEGMITSSSVFLEIGPHPVCLGMIRPTIDSTQRLLPSLHRKEDSLTALIIPQNF